MVQPAPASQPVTLRAFLERKLSVAGFEFFGLEDTEDIVVHPPDGRWSILLVYHPPGAYSVGDSEGLLPIEEKSLQGHVVSWVYEYYAGGAFRFR